MYDDDVIEAPKESEAAVMLQGLLIRLAQALALCACIAAARPVVLQEPSTVPIPMVQGIGFPTRRAPDVGVGS